MVFQRVCWIRRPRRLAVVVVLTILAIILIAYHQLPPSSGRRYRGINLLIRSKHISANNVQRRTGEDDINRGVAAFADRQQVKRENNELQDNGVFRNNEKPVAFYQRRQSVDSKNDNLLPTRAVHMAMGRRSDEFIKPVVDEFKEQRRENNVEEQEQEQMENLVRMNPPFNSDISRTVPTILSSAEEGDRVADEAVADWGNQTQDEGHHQSVLLSSGRQATGEFIKDLDRVVDFKKRVTLSVVDAGYVPMAINFLRTSLVNVKLTNYLMVCTDYEAVELLRREGIACSFYEVPTIKKKSLLERRLSRKGNKKEPRRKSSKLDDSRFSASNFGSIDYYRKSNAKTAVILSVLERGYDVLIIDVDVILFKDPFPFFNCSECDVHFQMDREMFNSGFAFIRSTPGSLLLYKTSWSLFSTYHKAHDQVYLNMAINRLNPSGNVIGYSRRVSNLGAVRLLSLPVNLFPCGAFYFERDNRMFANEPRCAECVMAHNNYIGSVSAKIYRFKENLLWTIDDNQYYTNSSARYFTYDNPVDLGRNAAVDDVEVDALKTALAISIATGRILILPTFRCCSRICRATASPMRLQLVPTAAGEGRINVDCSYSRHRCSLQSLLKLSDFDKVFKDRYREHSFLSNPLVPDSIRRAATSSAMIYINTLDSPRLTAQAAGYSYNHVVVTPADREHGATLLEVVQWMDERRNDAVIRFHSLYGATVDWKSNKSLSLDLESKFQSGFSCSEYGQWDSHLLDMANLWPENVKDKNRPRS